LFAAIRAISHDSTNSVRSGGGKHLLTPVILG
jgi:hypothetical protein